MSEVALLRSATTLLGTTIDLSAEVERLQAQVARLRRQRPTPAMIGWVDRALPARPHPEDGPDPDAAGRALRRLLVNEDDGDRGLDALLLAAAAEERAANARLLCSPCAAGDAPRRDDLAPVVIVGLAGWLHGRGEATRVCLADVIHERGYRLDLERAAKEARCSTPAR